MNTKHGSTQRGIDAKRAYAATYREGPSTVDSGLQHKSRTHLQTHGPRDKADDEVH